MIQAKSALPPAITLKKSRVILSLIVLLTASWVPCLRIHAATGSWSAGASNLFPAGNNVGLESRTDGLGSHVSPWIALLDNSGTVSVSPTPPNSASFISFGIVPISPGTLENIVCSASGKPVVYAVPSPSITHQVYYYDTASSSFKLSFIPTPGNLSVNLNNTQQGTFVGAMTADIHGNIVLEILSYIWKSADDGKTFSYVTDTAGFIQAPAPNNLPFGSVNTGLSYGNNTPNIQNIAGAPYGASVAPWGEIYIGKEFYSWRSYDDGQTWELIDPLWYQPVRDTATGVPGYPNLCMSFAMFGKGDGAGFTTDADVMLNSFRVSSYVNSSFPKFFRILPTGQIIHATNGDLSPVSSTYLTNGYSLSQGAGVGLITTKSGDTFGSIVWNTLPTGNPLNRNHNEIVKWDCDTKLWNIISPAAGGQPAAIASYTFARGAGDGDHYFTSSGPIYQWSPSLGTNLRPDVTLKQVSSNFPLIVVPDAATHIASVIPGNSFNVTDDHTPVESLIYSWSFRGQGRVTFDDTSALNATAYFSNPGFYVLTLTANDGALSGAISVTVKVLPATGGGGAAPVLAVAGQPANQILNLGQQIQIPLTATGSNLKYQWKRNGMELVDTVPGATSYVLQGQVLDYTGTTTNQLTIAAGRNVDDGAIYYCEISNEYGRVVSNSAAVGNAPAIIQGPVDNSTSNGDLSVSASGTQPFQWQWYSGVPGNGTKLTGAQSSMYHTTSAGSYYVVITNIFGSATSSAALIGAFPGNSVTFNLNGVNSNGTVASSASFLVGAQGTTLGIGTDSGLYSNWLYFTKWNSGNAHVTIASGFVNSPQSKFIVDSTASGTVSLSTSVAYFVNEYVLTVKNGFGTSSTHQYRFHSGDTVCVQAYAAPPGMIFNGWTVSKGGALSGGFVANPGNGKSLTKFLFPAQDVELAATYISNGANTNYTWSGADGAWAVGTAGWDAGNWIDGVNAIIGKGTETAGTITIAAAALVNPASITFNAAQAGAYSILVNGTISNGSRIVLGSNATVRGTNGTINRAIQTTATGILWPGAAAVGSAVPSAGESMSIFGLDMSNGGKLKIALNTSSSTSTQSLVVTGPSCALGGTLSLGIPAGAASGNVYTVLAGARTGTFSTILLNGAIVTGTSPVNVQYTANSVTVSLTGGVTAVTVDAFNARLEGLGALLSWNCISEFKNVGFNIYRRELYGVAWVKVNPALIAGRITNPDEQKYSYYDWAPAGTFEYKLESVGFHDEREFFYPEAGSVCVDWNSRLTKPGAVTVETLNAADGCIAANASLTHAAEVAALFAALDAQTLPDRNTSTDAAQTGNTAKRLIALPANSVRALKRDDPAVISARSLSTQSGQVAQTPILVPPSLPASSALAGVRWFTGGTPNSPAGSSGSSCIAAKVAYISPGVMLITQASLPAGFDLNHVALQREGRNFTALAITDAGLLVYAPGYQDDYTDKDVIFVRRIAGNTEVGPNAPATALFSSTLPLNVTSPATARNDYHDVYFDYNLRPYNFAPWFCSKYLTDGTSQPFTLSTPQAASGTSSLTINLWSLTDNSASVKPDHALQVMINNQLVGQANWDGGNKMIQLSFTIPSGVLRNGSNNVNLVTPSIAGLNSSTQIAFLHSMVVNYTCLLDGSQSIPIVSTGAVQLYELYNVPAGGAYVVDTRFTDHAALVPTQTVAQADGSMRLRFMTNTGSGGQYLVVPVGQENAPVDVSLRQIKPVRLSGIYLATGPVQFSTGVQQLLAARAKEGVRGMYADQEQLFDYYNFGRFGPAGIQKAVRALRPQYLLLLGRTTYDYRNYSGLNVDPLCPTFLVSTSFWAQSTSDSMFGDLGRGYPEVAVGRLPVANTGDLSVAVSRILGNKGLPQNGSGVRVHAVADLADPGAGDFASQLDGIQGKHTDLTWQRNYLGLNYQTVPEVHSAMSAAANGGADLILYAGHGNASRLGKGTPNNILDNSTTAGLGVGDWKGNIVFVQATCTANWAANNSSSYKSIAMRGLTQPGGGISASIASSTYMNSDVAAAFMDQLLRNAQAGTDTRWGTALMKTQQWAFSQASSNSFYTDIGNTEQILGDPAMRIYVMPVHSTNGVGGVSGDSMDGTQRGSF